MAASRVAASTSAAAAAMAVGGGGMGGMGSRSVGAGREGMAQVTVRQWTDLSQCLDLTQKELDLLLEQFTTSTTANAMLTQEHGALHVEVSALQCQLDTTNAELVAAYGTVRE